MGRSVSSLYGSCMKVYIDCSHFEEYDWGLFVEGLQEIIIDKYPSFSYADRWDGREDHIILENSICEVAVSEYCGLVCISGRATAGLGERFLGHVKKHLEANYDTYQRVGGFSDGSSIYERKEVN